MAAGLAALLLLGPGAAAAVRAAESAPAISPRAAVTLVSDVAAVAPGKPFRVAMHQRLTKGWHTYWTNPGDAGQPPEAAFTLPAGASAGPLQFPAPHRIPYGPLVNFGYETEAVFIAEIRPPADLPIGGTFPVTMQGSWLVCEKICIPEEATFRIELPVEASPRLAVEKSALFARAEASQPRASDWTARAAFSGNRGSLTLEGRDLAGPAVREAFFFPSEWGVLDHAAEQALDVRDGALTLTLTRGQGALAPQLDGVIAIVDGAGIRSAYTISAAVTETAAAAGPPAAAPAVQASPPGSGSPRADSALSAISLAPGAGPTAAIAIGLWQAIAWAMLGGLILNLMPCVFPILAMKAIGIARLSGAARAQVRGHALSYTAGVLASFVALALLLIGLRASGAAIGWGFQFTSPLFVTAMAWLMLAIGLNLSGVYQIGLSVTAGSSLAARGGHGGSFATGALAVLVATPCTAPFMAAAIGAALAMPAADMMIVFAAMGLGMAAPYALLALAPGLARLLPRPGIWMERLKQALAFPMYLAAVWLVWVVAQQAGADGVLAALAGGVLIAFAAWAFGLAQGSPGRGALAGRIAAAAALVGTAALLPSLAVKPAVSVVAATVAGEDAWSPQRVAALQAQGKPVFVNLTAAWCISCKVNERVALRAETVQQAFAERGITMLTGDWTTGDPQITALLRAHGREGVPLYLYYPTGSKTPVILPEILTPSIVLRTLEASAAG